MKKQALLALLATALVCTFTGCNIQTNPEPQMTGTISGDVANATDWENHATLDENEGGHLHFYAENKGAVDITITINGENAKNLAPGEAGSICTEVTNGLFGEKEYTFRAVPALSGKITFRYDIVQTFNP